jgi:transposase
MNYNYRYRLRPSDALEEQLAWTVDTCRQVYNHFLHRLNRTDDTSAYSEQKLLPSLKEWWDDLKQSSLEGSSESRSAVVRQPLDASRSQRERLPRRHAQVEITGRIPQLHLQSIGLQAQNHERSDPCVFS